MPILKASGLCFSLGGRWILHEVSFTLAEGEMVGVIGPNGSGKTTLIRLLSGIWTPQKGYVTLNGCPVTGLSRRKLAQTMAVVPQNSSLPEAFTVLEVVLMGRTPHLAWLQSEGAKDFQVAQQAMELTDTWEFAQRRVGELSGGERQRVLIARALAQESQVLLLDEPTAHLDLAHQGAVLDLVSRLNREEGITVLAVFHDLNLASQYCSRLIMLHQGRVYAQGSPQEVITAENLSAVYGAQLLVMAHPENRLPVTLVTARNGGADMAESGSSPVADKKGWSIM